jgi:hypothetical protein
MAETSGTDGRLPESCFVVVAGLAPGANVAIARRGRRGVEVTSIDFGDDTMARAAVRVVNEAIGISAAVERAMLAGAMFGWDCELADPAFRTKADRRSNRTTAMGFAGSAPIH